MSSQRRILFLCTGNYYRSRFAETLFNHHARARELNWSAFSRALAIERGHENVGPISHHTLMALERLAIPLPQPVSRPAGVCANDFQCADKVIALKEAEHKPLMLARWPDWAGKIDYWHVHDLDQASPEAATREIEELVVGLLDELHALDGRA